LGEGGGGVGLGFAGVDEPNAAEELLGAVLEHLEEQHVDGDVPRVEVVDDALGGGIQLGGDEDDLVGLVERFLVQRGAKAGLEGGVQALAAGEAPEDLRQALGGELFDPGGVVQRLGDGFARGAVAFEFDEHQGGVGRDGQQIDAPAVGGDFLAADEHPFVGEDARLAHDHLFELLLAGQSADVQGRGLIANAPDGVVDGHGIRW